MSGVPLQQAAGAVSWKEKGFFFFSPLLVHTAEADLSTCEMSSSTTDFRICSVLAFIRSLARKKPLEPAGEQSNFCRRLTSLDLIGLGVGGTLGAGVYVLSGEVAREVTGPSIIISFLVAAVASVFAGLCYAELGARVPKMGSAYLYSYVTIGEVWAFVTGWNLLLSYVIETSSIAKAWTGAFDDLIHNVMAKHLGEHTPMDSPGLAEYPDFFAAALIMLLAGVLAFGLKESAIVNTVFTAVNVSVLIFIITSGFIKGDLENWHISKKTVLNATWEVMKLEPNETVDFGVGGFFPFGFDGTLAGAATCFYAFFGFDCIVATGTLYLLGVMLPMPRVLYAMARDGLLFKPLSYMSSRQSPVLATLSSGAVAAFMVLLFDLKALVDMSSIGTIFAYTLVAVCLLILRDVLRPPFRATHRTSKNVTILTIIILFLVIVLTVLLSEALYSLSRWELWSVLLVSVLVLTLVLAVVIIWRQPQSRTKASFMVPCVPVIPVLSVFINTYFMVQLEGETWVSYAVWMAIGLIVYFGYGVRHSVQKQRLQEAHDQLSSNNVSSDVVDCAA
ncbi:cationic amino acid transporter 2-like [Neolamprologus brichardi]|uniref:cationic amino acid transporter 2-like n=1 Tax=Neolamprologus brichardi TaxID=32507 RepID=UPI001643DB06|nr:cationic amino acid transporter 2-like [Neolamprologus brichardi]